MSIGISYDLFIQQNKAAVSERLEELATRYKEWETLVVEHRADKERQRMREEQERKENNAAVKVCILGGGSISMWLAPKVWLDL